MGEDLSRLTERSRLSLLLTILFVHLANRACQEK
jgi:hypothetical protein